MTKTTARCDWYAIVYFGPDHAPATGPFRGREEAERAWDRFCERHGALAGTYLAASSARIVGPFRTRKIAAEADISDYPKYLYEGDEQEERESAEVRYPNARATPYRGEHGRRIYRLDNCSIPGPISGPDNAPRSVLQSIDPDNLPSGWCRVTDSEYRAAVRRAEQEGGRR